MVKQLYLFLLVCSLTACAATGEYTCGVPQNGVGCQSMTDTHEQLYDGSLASLHTEPFPEADDSDTGQSSAEMPGSRAVSTETPTSETRSPALGLPTIKTLDSKDAILSRPREMRIWFDRYIDIEGDLHDESFIFVRIDHGHWLIDNKPILE